MRVLIRRAGHWRVLLALAGTAVIASALVVEGLQLADNLASVLAALLGLVSLLIMPRGDVALLSFDEVVPEIRRDARLTWAGLRAEQEAGGERYQPVEVIQAGAWGISLTDLCRLEDGDLLGPSWSVRTYARMAASIPLDRQVGRAVVHGPPGTGKTTFARMLAAGLVEDPRAPIPLLVPLAGWNGSEDFVAWLNRWAAQAYPSIRSLPEGVRGGRLGRLLLSGTCMLILDEFDEVPAGAAGRVVHALRLLVPADQPLFVLGRPRHRSALDDLPDMAVLAIDRAGPVTAPDRCAAATRRSASRRRPW